MQNDFSEPTLRELLDDPLTAAVMACDHVSRDAILDLVIVVAAKRMAVAMKTEPHPTLPDRRLPVSSGQYPRREGRGAPRRFEGKRRAET
jgi:hypothetical protein